LVVIIIGNVFYRQFFYQPKIESSNESKEIAGVSTSAPVPSEVPTFTPFPTPLKTATPKPSPKVTSTPSPTPQPTSTNTPSPTATATPTSNSNTNSVSTGHLPIKGDSGAKVTIIEFSDFQCPYCKTFFNDTFNQINSEYIQTGKVKFAYRHFPLNFHTNAEKAALASECANEQGKFWDMHSKLFNEQNTWATQSSTDVVSTFNTYASSMGMDSSKFSSCMNDNKFMSNINEDKNAAQSLGISGTPTFYINGQVLNGAMPFSSFKTIIDQELAK
jgi:protein-disulfide isomerase